MTNREVMQQALVCIERCNQHGWILADYEDEVYASIDALKAALAQPAQEPSQWRDMIVTSLVREGIDKHRARELADHFAAQRPWQGLTEFQFAEIYNRWNDTNGSTAWGLNQALEAKLKELNT